MECSTWARSRRILRPFDKSTASMGVPVRLSWNEIRTRAAEFSREWADASYEKGETQSFYNDFFEVFGVKRRRVATYERQVKKLDNRHGFIDLFWPGVVLVEQKSAGRDLGKAREQADEYCLGLKPAEFPRHILLSDFQTFELYDLDEGAEVAFALADLSDHVEHFGFILGLERRTFEDQDPVNIEAAELMGRVHDALEASGYSGHALEQYLVRLLFCLFADDTGIFEPRGIFQELVEQRTAEDGSDLGAWLTQLFDTLNTPEGERYTTLDLDLAEFPYVNGQLFDDQLRIPAFSSQSRALLIEACEFSWDAVSPAVFGSLFQSVMNRSERRKMGAHYTTEQNILKVLEPLFLDELREEFERLRRRKTNRTKLLTEFHERLGKLTVFDPACGCGNFLVIAYRELRKLELDVLQELRSSKQLELDATALSRVDVDQFYGIEVSEFPARIAEVAMWMMDHIMNVDLSLRFGLVYTRIPLAASAHVVVGNAIDTDWGSVLPAAECNYVVGNPPFRGHQYRSKSQKADMKAVWGTGGQFRRLDYVTCWFKKAQDYSVANEQIRIGFVSVNSITQGEQAGILWPALFEDGLRITFAHRTFQWNSEARGKAAVHCVVIGLARRFSGDVRVFDYEHVRGDPMVANVSRLNCYLVDGPDRVVPARTRPPEGRMQLIQGSKPADGARIKDAAGKYVTRSNLILKSADREDLLDRAPEAEKWLRPYVGSKELISGDWRWCLWLKDADLQEVRRCKPVVERLERVREGRALSPTAVVREYAAYPHLFREDRQPDRDFIAVPEVSSETREYIPIAILPKHVIASNKLLVGAGGGLVEFGILSSAMHMAWMRTVGGRLKSDYSYAPSIYNTFPWPDVAKERAVRRLEAAAKLVLDLRSHEPSKSLDDLYDADWMPKPLRDAHKGLDRVVDRLYRNRAFNSERERVEFLFSIFDPSM